MNNTLKQLRETYRNETLSTKTVDHLWQELSLRLPAKTQYSSYQPFFRYGIILICIVFLAGGGIVGIAQAAKPSTPLYPVKILTDKVVKKAASIYYTALQQHVVSAPAEAPSNTTVVSPTASLTIPSHEQGTENNPDISSNKKIESAKHPETTDAETAHPIDAPSQNASDNTAPDHGQNQRDVKGAQTEQETKNPSTENKLNAEEHSNSNQGKNDASSEEENGQKNSNSPKKNN